MKDWAAFSFCLLIALWILGMGLATLLWKGPGPHERPEPPALPMGKGLQELRRLLKACPSSAYSRDRIQDRLQVLAGDLASIGQECKDEVVAAYLAEDHAGFKGRVNRKQHNDPDFLDRTLDALRRLEHARHEPEGGPS